jgi:hypothetical protein
MRLSDRTSSWEPSKLGAATALTNNLDIAATAAAAGASCFIVNPAE